MGDHGSVLWLWLSCNIVGPSLYGMQPNFIPLYMCLDSHMTQEWNLVWMPTYVAQRRKKKTSISFVNCSNPMHCPFGYKLVKIDGFLWSNRSIALLKVSLTMRYRYGEMGFSCVDYLVIVPTFTEDEPAHIFHLFRLFLLGVNVTYYIYLSIHMHCLTLKQALQPWPYSN